MSVMSVGAARGSVAALLIATFIVALAYGAMLPVLPAWVERQLGPDGDSDLHTGLVTAAYPFGLFLFAPFWGRCSDRWDRKRIILVGLLGTATALALPLVAGTIELLYLGRLLAGGFAAAVLPVAQALVADQASGDERRARGFAWLGMSSSAGFLAGPALGGLAGSAAGAGPDGMAFLSALLAAAAAAAALVALRWLPRAAAATGARLPTPVERNPDLLWLLLVSAVVGGALGAFEVDLAVRGRQSLGLGAGELGLLFAECMLVMMLAQAAAFNRWVRPRRSWRLIAPATLAVGLALLLVPIASSRLELAIGTGAVAAAAGILIPLVAFWIATVGGRMRGLALGRQAAVASLGQAAGSGLAGFLSQAEGTASGGVILAAGAALVTGLMALRFGRRLEPYAVALKTG